MPTSPLLWQLSKQLLFGIGETSKNGHGTPAVYRPLLLKSESQFLNEDENPVHMQEADQKRVDLVAVNLAENLCWPKSLLSNEFFNLLRGFRRSCIRLHQFNS